MGITLKIGTDVGKECPFWFSQTDSKQLCRQLTVEIYDKSGDLHRFLMHLGLNLEPLKKISGEEYTLEMWMELNLPYFEGDKEKQRQGWYEHKKEIEAGYQDPSKLIAALNPVIEALQKHRRIFNELKIIDWYFTEGFFQQDLIDLKGMLEWAEKENVKRVRLEVS